jgi:hypothetical protein
MVSALAPPAVNASVDLSGERKPISPYIYGINGVDPQMTQKSARQGGNRLTGYNWHNNYSSAGSDWQHFSDSYLLGNLPNTPGVVVTDFALKAADAGAYSVVTLPMAGYVARDGMQTVTAEETAPSERWAKAVDRKPGEEFTMTPDTDADTVYSDELLNFLVQTLGDSSSATGIKGYCLDNEPALWNSTHPRIHPEQLTVDELLKRTVSLASVVKEFDPGAEVYGPVLYGFNAYMTLQNAEDWNDTYSSLYTWFIDCYLDKMRQTEAEEGRRLLDVLDLHYYSEAQNGQNQRVSFGNQTDDDSAHTRVQSVRSLWDASYTENSWIGQWFSRFLPLLPRVQASIDEFYPGTKLAFTEYSFGAENHISGGVAIADALGVFAEHGVYLATLWPLTGNRDFADSAVNMFTNCDGEGLAFGGALLPVSADSPEWGGVYVSEDADGKMHLMLIGKDVDNPVQFNLTIGGDWWVERRFVLDGEGPAIREETPEEVFSDGLLAVTVPKMSVSHLVLAPGSAPPPSPPEETPFPEPSTETPAPSESPAPSGGGANDKEGGNYWIGITAGVLGVTGLCGIGLYLWRRKRS